VETPALGLASATTPLVSVVVLNYNGAQWLPRCLESLRQQTIFPQIEVILADNASPDNSAELAKDIMNGWSNGRVLRHGKNLGFCQGNNRAAEHAKAEYLLFLNNDTWLEPACLERLLAGAKSMNADAASPLVMDYEDDSIQASGGEGFDLFGLMSLAQMEQCPQREIFVVPGCSYLIRKELFQRLGGFDEVFFMYADEYDLSWRVWISGARAVLVPGSRLHHRGAANVNPAGGRRVVEMRSSDSKRFYTNRNCLLLLLKNCQNVLLVMFFFQVCLLLIESLFALALVRRWSFVRRAYVEAVLSCWRLRAHIWSERRRLNTLRRRSDWQMLRFLRPSLNRWDEIRSFRKRGMPRFTPS
jgi:GT2 family glycosyltransferase